VSVRFVFKVLHIFRTFLWLKVPKLEPLTVANAQLLEASRYLERDSRYSPGDRLQDKDGVSLSDKYDDEHMRKVRE
jgi:hypothetical protein